ncbi:hypothetical protein DYB36_005621 [Aphanomyces astaci]|uniref:CUE domain-containing protein n=1 Tax=Aphanomyces astaci TaxID=112090 RepID=A0A396ZSF0_APHAT|nr:hypothetical protein DYB36_005621 [Aphanomyces astaci]
MSIRGSKFATSNSRNKHSSRSGGSSMHHRNAQSFARLNSLDYHDEIMDAYGGSYNYDYGVSSHHGSIQTMAHQATSAISEEESESNLSMLMNAFPEVDPSIVQDIFIAKNFDVCGTAEILSGLLPPSTEVPAVVVPTSGTSDTDGDDDGEWSYHDADDAASVGSVDWVVVHDEWEVVDPNTSSTFGRSYSDVLLAPHAGLREPFETVASQSIVPSTPSTSSSPLTASSTKDAAEDQYSLCDDYYDIKEYGQRARLSRRPSSHPKAKKQLTPAK